MNSRAYVLAVMVLAACGSTTSSTRDATAASSTSVASSVVSSSVPAPLPSSAVTSTTALPTSTVPTSTTSAAVRRVALAPGDPLVLEDRLADNPYFRSTDADTVTLDAWFVDVVPPPGTHQVSALLGQATVFRDGRVRLTSSVPTIVAERTGKFGVAVARPTVVGAYRIEGIAGVEMLVDVTRDAPPAQFQVSRPPSLPPELQVLGDSDLAGIEFGTRDDEADDRLVARFGSPTGRKDWQDGCGGQYRWVWWGGLVVEFQRERPGADGRLATYRYGAPEWFFPGADADVAAVRRLGTEDGVVLGTPIAQLRGLAPGADFLTGYQSFLANHWHVPGRDVVATLDGDVLSADARVVRISAPREAALTVC